MVSPSPPPSPLDVALVSMPYASVEHPSIGLGILKSCLREAGLSAEVYYENLRFAKWIGISNYSFISSSSNTDFLGDWSFAGCAFPDFAPNQAEYVAVLARSFIGFQPRTIKALAWNTRDSARPFVAAAADRVLARGPKIVGCTSTFQQHVASLALLRRVKEVDPSVITMIGGANCEESMGEATHEFFPFVDYVVSGEADNLIGPLCQRLLQGGPPPGRDEIPEGVWGPAHRVGEARSGPPQRHIVDDLDKVPTPDYHDYFTALEESGIEDFVEPGLLAETSRGCWWGQRKHCTFCGLNGNGMGFRSKSPEVVVEELAKLSATYGIDRIAVVDNILDHAYFKSVLPQLARRSPRYSLLYETKSNLKRNQVELLADAGIRFIQPGVETMDGELSKRMNKGNTAWSNIQLLKCSLEYGVFVSWNFLYGIPGETDEVYAEMASWLPLIAHLQPPNERLVRIRFDRFSVYHSQQEVFGLELKPFWSYGYVYPLSEGQLQRLAYYFVDHSERRTKEFAHRPGLEQLQVVVSDWFHHFYDCESDRALSNGAVPPNPDRPVLLQEEAGADRLRVTDTRACATAPEHLLEGAERAVLLACEEAQTPDLLERKLAPETRPGEVAAALERLLADKLVISVVGRLVSLPVSPPREEIPNFDQLPSGLVRPLGKDYQRDAAVRGSRVINRYHLAPTAAAPAAAPGGAATV